MHASPGTDVLMTILMAARAFFLSFWINYRASVCVLSMAQLASTQIHTSWVAVSKSVWLLKMIIVLSPCWATALGCSYFAYYLCRIVRVFVPLWSVAVNWAAGVVHFVWLVAKVQSWFIMLLSSSHLSGSSGPTVVPYFAFCDRRTVRDDVPISCCGLSLLSTLLLWAAVLRWPL